MNIIIDTNVLNAYINSKDALHQAAVKALAEIGFHDRIIIPLVVALEIVVGSERPNNIISFLSDLVKGFEPTTKNDLLFISKIPYKKRRTLKAIDCSILGICDRTNAKLITFDRNLEKYYLETIR